MYVIATDTGIITTIQGFGFSFRKPGSFQRPPSCPLPDITAPRRPSLRGRGAETTDPVVGESDPPAASRIHADVAPARRPAMAADAVPPRRWRPPPADSPRRRLPRRPPGFRGPARATAREGGGGGGFLERRRVKGLPRSPSGGDARELKWRATTKYRIASASANLRC